MTNLEDIARNPNEFNVSYHMKQLLGITVFAIFDNKYYIQHVEKIMKTSYGENAWFKVFMIADSCKGIVEQYLNDDVGDRLNDD